MECSFCGMANMPSDRVCARCGQSLSDAPRLDQAGESIYVRRQEFSAELTPKATPLDADAMKHAAAAPYEMPAHYSAISGASAPPTSRRSGTKRGQSDPPPLRTQERQERVRPIPPEQPARVGPVRVRRVPERARPKTTDRKVSLYQSRVNIGMLLLLVLVSLLVVAGVGYLVLTRSPAGQMQLAAWGYEAPASAYWQLGDSQLREGYVSKALEYFQKASEMEPGKVDGLLLMGTAYERDGQQEKAIELYKSLIDPLREDATDEEKAALPKDRAAPIAPGHPEAYARLATMLRDENKHSEALAMMELGYEKTGAEQFTNMIHNYAPQQPEPSKIGARYNEEITLELKSLDECKILYTRDSNLDKAEFGKNPALYGTEYTEPLAIGEGTVRVLAVAVQENGVPSKVMDETYTVLYPTPNAPKANIAPGKYEKAPLVSLRPGETEEEKKNKTKMPTIVEIHYTVDNTPATKYSPLYETPIRLGLGKTVLRAIAVDERGKVSYEMNVSYEVKGAVKPMFKKEDVFSGLELMKTTMDQFTKAHGQPDSSEPTDDIGGHAAIKASYGWGHAVFVETEEGGKPVLCELTTTSTSFTGPRGLKVGDSSEKIIESFRDYGGPTNDKGERVLYNNGLDNLGVYKQEDDGSYAIHYYYPRSKNEYAELSFYLKDGVAKSVSWLRYLGN